MLFFSLKTPLMRNADGKRPPAPASLKTFSSLLLLNGLFLLPVPWAQPGDSLGAGGSMGDWDCFVTLGRKVPRCPLAGCVPYLQALSRAPVVPAPQAVTTNMTGKAKDQSPSLQGENGLFSGAGSHSEHDYRSPISQCTLKSHRDRKANVRKKPVWVRGNMWE